MAENGITKNYELLVIGGSAGSLKAILEFFPHIKPNNALSIILVVHRKGGQEGLLIDLLTTKTQWKVKEADDKDIIVPSTVYVAPADYHLLIEKDGTIALDDSEKVNFSRPSIDVTFQSAAYAYGESLVCLLLSGANADGTEGMKIAHEHGALTAVQDPEESEVSFMPASAILSKVVDRILSPSEMSGFINNLPHNTPLEK